MCGLSLERLNEIVTDQDHEEFLDKLDKAISTLPQEIIEKVTNTWNAFWDVYEIGEEIDYSQLEDYLL